LHTKKRNKYLFALAGFVAGCLIMILSLSTHEITTTYNVPGPRIGAICNDGTRSYSTGSGTCSWHGGVDYWLYSGSSTRTTTDQSEPNVGGAILGVIITLFSAGYGVVLYNDK